MQPSGCSRHYPKGGPPPWPYFHALDPPPQRPSRPGRLHRRPPGRNGGATDAHAARRAKRRVLAGAGLRATGLPGGQDNPVAVAFGGGGGSLRLLFAFFSPFIRLYFAYHPFTFAYPSRDFHLLSFPFVCFRLLPFHLRPPHPTLRRSPCTSTGRSPTASALFASWTSSSAACSRGRSACCRRAALSSPSICWRCPLQWYRPHPHLPFRPPQAYPLLLCALSRLPIFFPPRIPPFLPVTRGRCPGCALPVHRL